MCRPAGGVDRTRTPPRCKGRTPGGDLLEATLLETDEIHFVDGQHDLADPEQRADKSVPLGLRQHALARVHQDYGELAGRRAGRHIAGILLMAWRVRQDKSALWCREKPVGDIDRDALLALVFPPVIQRREVVVLPAVA